MTKLWLTIVLILPFASWFSCFKLWLWWDNYQSRPIKPDIQVQNYWLQPVRKNTWSVFIGLVSPNPEFEMWNNRLKLIMVNANLQMVVNYHSWSIQCTHHLIIVVVFFFFLLLLLLLLPLISLLPFYIHWDMKIWPTLDHWTAMGVTWEIYFEMLGVSKRRPDLRLRPSKIRSTIHANLIILLLPFTHFDSWLVHGKFC